LQEGVDLIVQVLRPYMTEEALAELGSGREGVRMRGEE
jgi:hypothetical protein